MDAKSTKVCRLDTTKKHKQPRFEGKGLVQVPSDVFTVLKRFSVESSRRDYGTVRKIENVWRTRLHFNNNVLSLISAHNLLTKKSTYYTYHDK